MKNRIGLSRIAKWPGDLSALTGISPGGPISGLGRTEATSKAGAFPDWFCAPDAVIPTAAMTIRVLFFMTGDPFFPWLCAFVSGRGLVPAALILFRWLPPLQF